MAQLVNPNANSIRSYMKDKLQKAAIASMIYLTVINPGIPYFLNNSPKVWAKDAYSTLETVTERLMLRYYEK